MAKEEKYNFYTVLDEFRSGKKTVLLPGGAERDPDYKFNMYTELGLTPRRDPRPALVGREAGTSSRDAQGRPIGSKAHRAMKRRDSEVPLNQQGPMPSFGSKR